MTILHIKIVVYKISKEGNGGYLSKLTACKARQNATNNKHKIASVRSHIHTHICTYLSTHTICSPFAYDNSIIMRWDPFLNNLLVPEFGGLNG